MTLLTGQARTDMCSVFFLFFLVSVGPDSKQQKVVLALGYVRAKLVVYQEDCGNLEDTLSGVLPFLFIPTCF